tara:strand:+ start:5207 stop:5509 length:303 start_codon:yes stop_codon:yes gene_type:complete
MKTLTQIGVDKLISFFTRVSGTKGCKYIGTAAYAGPKFGSIVINEDAVVASAASSSGADLKALWGVGSNTIKAGTLLTVDIEDPGSAITLTSGSAIVYFD